MSLKQQLTQRTLDHAAEVANLPVLRQAEIEKQAAEVNRLLQILDPGAVLVVGEVIADYNRETDVAPSWARFPFRMAHWVEGYRSKNAYFQYMTGNRFSFHSYDRYRVNFELRDDNSLNFAVTEEESFWARLQKEDEDYEAWLRQKRLNDIKYICHEGNMDGPGYGTNHVTPVDPKRVPLIRAALRNFGCTDEEINARHTVWEQQWKRYEENRLHEQEQQKRQERADLERQLLDQTRAAEKLALMEWQTNSIDIARQSRLLVDEWLKQFPQTFPIYKLTSCPENKAEDKTTAVSYVLSAEPDESGWYIAIDQRGEANRIKVFNRLLVEEAFFHVSDGKYCKRLSVGGVGDFYLAPTVELDLEDLAEVMASFQELPQLPETPNTATWFVENYIEAVKHVFDE